MSTIKTIAKNTIVLVAANFISLAIGFGINIIIANYLTETDFGLVNAALNLATLATIITDLGVSKYLTIEVSRDQEKKNAYLNSALTIKLLLIGVAYAAILAYTYLNGFRGTEMLVVLILGLYVMTTVITQVFQAILQALQAMEHIAICQLINPIILLGGAAYVVFTGKDVVAFALVYLFSGLIVLSYTVTVLVSQYLKRLPRPGIALWKPIVAGGIPLSLSGLFYFLYYRIDIQLITNMLGLDAVANYSAAFKLVEAIICIPYMYAMAVFPLISMYFHRGDSKLQLLFRQSIKYLYMMGLPVVIGTFILADQFIYLLYPGRYLASIEVLRVLSLGVLIIYLNVVSGDMLIATNMQKISMVINGIAAVVNIGLNILVIPMYGIVGSAYAMLATQLVLFILNTYFIHKAGYRHTSLADMLKISICGLVMGLFVYVSHGQNLLAIIAIAAVIYCALILITRALGGEDAQLLSEIFPWVSKIPWLKV